MEKGKQEENDEVIDVLGEHQPRMGCVYESLHWIEKRGCGGWIVLCPY